MNPVDKKSGRALGVPGDAAVDLRRLVHELQVHQLELVTQNEELLRIQDDLDAERRKYADLYDFAPVGYCTLAVDGTIVEANLACATLLGVGRATLIGQAFSVFVADQDAAIYHDYRDQLRSASGPSLCEARLTRRAAGPFWAQLTASVGEDAERRRVVRLALNDISARKRAEDALQEHRAFSQLIAENIGDFIAILDRAGRRLYNSPSYLRFFGGNRDLRGSDSFAEIHPDDRERVKHIFRETVRTGVGVQTEYRLVIADGSVRDLESRASVITDHDGTVARVVVVSHDVSDRKRLEAQVLQQAFHDPLTRLPNRRLLDDRLSQSLAASARSGCHGAVMALDLDGFKPVNDRLGHAAGDLLLIEVARRLKNSVRDIDTVARSGGDEFVVVISELVIDKVESLAHAAIIAEKIRATLAEPYQVISRRDDKTVSSELRCTVSIGVALFADHQISQDQLLSDADAAMYEAKAAGCNSIFFHS